jgi:hypothetical protein
MLQNVVENVLCRTYMPLSTRIKSYVSAMFFTSCSPQNKPLQVCISPCKEAQSLVCRGLSVHISYPPYSLQYLEALER